MRVIYDGMQEFKKRYYPSIAVQNAIEVKIEQEPKDTTNYAEKKEIIKEEFTYKPKYAVSTEINQSKGTQNNFITRNIQNKESQPTTKNSMKFDRFFEK